MKKIRINLTLKILLISIFIIFIISRIYTIKLFNSNEVLIDYLMDNSNHLVTSNYTYKDKFNDLIFLLVHHNFSKPDSLFENNYIYNNDTNDTKKKEEKNMETFNELKEPEPLVYIYNTHQKEEYLANQNDINNLKPTVYTASFILKDNLKKEGINSVVEESDITAYLTENNLTYDDSYVSSKYYLEQEMKKYPSIKLFIDLHRDALNHDLATTYYENKYYSKVLFVVGLDYENYESNLELANYLNNLIEQKYPFLTRGVLKKTGPLVNGIYNQNLSNNIILLEVGGNESYIEEVENTIELVSDIIKIYLGV